MNGRCPLLILADALPKMGSGHIMRCRALAAAARKAGMPVALGGHCGIDWLRPLLRQENSLLLDGSPPAEENPHTLLARLEQMARNFSLPLTRCAVVLDGYHFTQPCQSAVRKAACALLVVDDYCHLPRYDCDILLNQNPCAEDYIYSGEIGKKLLGLRYTLIRQEFQTNFPGTRHAGNILLSLGGGNFSSFLAALVPLLSIPQMSGKTLRVIAGSMPQEVIRKNLGGLSARLEILPRVDDMPALLADTEVCISAGGSTCWELCRIGVPFLTVEVAENQRNICNWLDRHGYAPRFSGAAFAELLESAELRRERSSAVRRLVDGRGAERVVQCLNMLNMPYKNENMLLRDVQSEDKEFIFKLVNEKIVRSVSFQSEKIAWETHSKWFALQLAERNPFYIVLYNNVPCGYIRFEKDKENMESQYLILTLAVQTEFRGKNIGTFMIREACRRILENTDFQHIHAWVKQDNSASLHVFEKCGFLRAGATIKCGTPAVCFVYPDDEA